MSTKYIISKRPCKHAAYRIEAEDADGVRELLCLCEYLAGARRMAEELQRLAPSIPLIDETRKEVAHAR